MELVDGNALAGVFLQMLTHDATMLEVECRGCGSVALLAETLVERDEFAAIVRCRGCTHTLLTLLQEASGTRIVFAGVAALGVASGE